MSWNQIKELQERRAALAKNMKGILDGAEKENRSINGEEQNKFDSIAKDVDVLDKRIADLKKAQSVADVDSRSFNDGVETVEDNKSSKEERSAKAFDRWLRNGHLDAEFRDLAISSNTVGNRTHYGAVVEAMKAFAGPLQAGAEIITTTDGNTFAISTSDDTSNSGELVTEAGSNTVDSSLSLATTSLSAYKFGSKIFKVSNELLADAAFDVAAYVARVAGERIGRVSNTYMTTGTGSSQPQGVITASGAGKTAASSSTFTYDELLDLYHSLDVAYRNSPNCAFMFSDTVAAFLRKMNTGTGGTYLWTPGAAGEPDRILGKPYVVNNDMDTAFTTGKKLVLIGDFSRYKIRMVQGVELVRLNELYQAAGQVGFVAWLRWDAKATEAAAFKHLKLA